jgi:hypothetical protein
MRQGSFGAADLATCLIGGVDCFPCQVLKARLDLGMRENLKAASTVDLARAVVPSVVERRG